MEAAGQVAQVIVSTKGKPDEVIELAERLTIGRSGNNQLVIADENSSRRHAEIRHLGSGRYRLFDVGSANGTWLNGRRVTVPKDLENGDEILIGGVSLRFVAPDLSASDQLSVTDGGDTSFKTALAMTHEVVVILVCDIRNYTTMSESLPGAEFSQFVSEWFREASDVIEQHGGTVDKFIGDAIMVYWRVRDREQPSPQVNSALAASRGLIKLADGFSRRLAARFEGREFRVGIGINLGDAVFGNIGTGENQSFTVVGDSVNVAFRLESLTKEKGHPVIAGRSIADHANRS
ncbi:MAG: FHA domain-containing protein, partial [Gammaproteobacteria bacterium]